MNISVMAPRTNPGFLQKSLGVAAAVSATAMATSAWAATDMVCTAIPNSASLLCTPAAVNGTNAAATIVQVAQTAGSGGHALVGSLIGGVVGLLLGGISLPDNPPADGGSRLVVGGILAAVGGAIGHFI